MTVLSKNYPGLTCVCERCGALLAYELSDIYGDLVYCPICKNANQVLIDKNYDGRIDEKE